MDRFYKSPTNHSPGPAQTIQAAEKAHPIHRRKPQRQPLSNGALIGRMNGSTGMSPPPVDEDAEGMKLRQQVLRLEESMGQMQSALGSVRLQVGQLKDENQTLKTRVLVLETKITQLAPHSEDKSPGAVGSPQLRLPPRALGATAVTAKLVYKTLTKTFDKSYTEVVFDLETTSLSRSADITQIAAACGNKTFNQYVMPAQPISAKASEITGLTKRDGLLYRNGELVKGVLAPKRAFSKFLDYLKSVNVGVNVVLVAHNGKRFDVPVLIQAFRKENQYDLLQETVHGFIDSLPLFKKVFPSSTSHKLADLVKGFLGHELHDAHNALADVEGLRDLLALDACLKVNRSQEIFTIADMSAAEKQSMLRRELLETRALSEYMAKKIVAADLSLKDIKTAYQQNGEEGVKELMMQGPLGKPRVTKDQNVIQKIVKYCSDC